MAARTTVAVGLQSFNLCLRALQIGNQLIEIAEISHSLRFVQTQAERFQMAGGKQRIMTVALIRALLAAWCRLNGQVNESITLLAADFKMLA